MAVIEKHEIKSSQGIKKEIDKNSTTLALDILQRGLYAFPIQSCIRELASNAYDAIKERDVAKSILSNKTKIEDHFDTTKDEDGIYTDSGFDASYFDEKWLSDDPNVFLYYEEGKQKDILRVVDNGVGLGKKRLVGYFQLNYSTKRKNKDALGKWGLGSKVALALGVDSFRVITRYNGKKFKFDVFLDKVESVIPKFGDNGLNEAVLLKEKTDTQEEYIAYCEDTTEKNGLELIVEIKKHNKQKFFEAIESQLMYMPNIKFMYREENRMTHEHRDVMAEILYKDKDIVLSKSTVYNKPHILLGTGDALINYGFVAFNELEIEPKGGSVGLILDINEIEVTPSREAPVWSARTREAVLKKYNDVTSTATKLVESQLKSETDYLKWLGTASSTMHALKYGNSGDNDSVVSRLASIIDVQAISNLRFPGDQSIYFKTEPKAMLGEYVTAWMIKYDSYNKKIERKKITDVSDLNRPLYFVGDKANGLVDRYLYEENGKFVHIRFKEDAPKNNKFIKHIEASTMKLYDHVVVPPDRLEMYESEDLVEEEEDVVVANVAAKNRKANNEIVVHTLKSGSTSFGKYYSFAKTDKKVTDLYQMNQDNTCLYCSYGEREYLHQIMEMLPQCMLDCGSYYQDSNVWEYITDKRKVSSIMVAADNMKYLKGSNSFTALDKFILEDYDEETCKLTFSTHLKLAASFAFIKDYVNESYQRVLDGLNKDTLKLMNKDDHHDINCFTGPWHNASYGPQSLATNQKWYKDCIRYHAAQLGIIELDEDTTETLLESIDSELPDVLCERIDGEVKEIDILDKKLINRFLDMIKYYAPVASLIKETSNSYYSDATQKQDNAKKLSILCKMINENPQLVDDWDFPNYLGETKDDE